jgi:hypothetical protein
MSKLIIMSLSIEPETKDWVEIYSKEEGESSSKIIRECVKKYLINKDQITVVEKPPDKVTIVEHSDEYIPVVIKIPSALRGDPKVKEWLQIKCDAIANKLGS